MTPASHPMGVAGTVAAPAVSPDAARRLYAFEVTRRAVPAAATVRPRRVAVQAGSWEAALAGAGLAKDEAYRLVPPRLRERFAAWQPLAREELADFYETVGNALLTGGGMRLALNMAARMARSPRMRGTAGALHEAIRHGEELHVAMRRFPQLFSPMQLAMVEAAAATGLDKAGGLLITLSQRLQRDGRVARKFVGALAYPVALMVLTLLGAVVLEIWALPPMVELFRTLGGRLPFITRAFYAVAQFIHAHAVGLGATAAGLGGAAAVAIPRLVRHRLAQRLAVRLWVVGPIVQWLALVRALSTFMLLKQSGARVRDQFAMAAAAAGNCVVGGFFEACYARIALGESVEEAFTAERHRLGNDGIRIAGRMEIGMSGGDLSHLIDGIVAELDERAEARLDVLPHLLRWPLLIGCCVIIGAVALAIVLPYPNLIADVAHQQSQAAQPR